MALPGTHEAPGRLAFSVVNKGKAKGYAWSWLERVEPGKPRVENLEVLAVRVRDQAEKAALLAGDPDTFFTEPHYNGFPAVLVRLGKVSRTQLRQLLQAAWLCQAPRELREKMAAKKKTAGRGAVIDRLRKVAMALPGTTEKLSHGEVCFFNGRSFVSVDDHHHGSGHLALWCRAEPEVQRAFVEASPEHFFVPPYVGTAGWIGIRLDSGLDWAVITRFVEDAWRQAPAPRKKSARARPRR